MGPRQSRHSATIDIWLRTVRGGQFNVSQYLSLISLLEGAKVYSKTGWGAIAGFTHRPGSATECKAKLTPPYQRDDTTHCAEGLEANEERLTYYRVT